MEHAKSLPALPPELRPGATLCEDAFAATAASSGAKWFLMPSWLCGTWSRPSPPVILSEVNLVTGKQTDESRPSTVQFQGNEVCGYQKDSKGRVWHCALVPYRRVFVDEGGGKSVSIVDSSDVIESNDQRLIIKRFSTRLTTDSSREIKKVVRCQEYTEYVPDGYARAKTDASIKYFDEDGKPLMLQKTSCKLIRVAPFRVCDYWPHDEQVDLKDRFAEFQNAEDVRTGKVLKYGSPLAIPKTTRPAVSPPAEKKKSKTAPREPNVRTYDTKYDK